ncbi:MAG: alpha/beta hydrolase, partial [Candidatus Aminicenantes bacterium]|nr:alpha/beta hydrolase [Candidatus Aminicenantes bacterium]
NGPFTLIGFSWGAWLAWLTVSRHPELVNKLVLVGSGPFESLYAEGILETRLKRLSEGERAEVLLLSARLQEGDKAARNRSLVRLGELITKADAYDPLPLTEKAIPPVEIDADIFSAVWPEADEMRRSGLLLEAGRNIRCPVIALHGAYDPHPAEGVERPLSAILPDFRFILLPQCGHRPWIERHARGRFFQIL